MSEPLRYCTRMTDTTDGERLLELLRKHWPVRCDVVGERSLRDVVEAIQEGKPVDDLFARAEGGRDFDMLTTLQVLAQAAILIKACVEIYKLLRENFGRKPTKVEIAEELKSSPVLSQLTDDDVIAKIGAVIDDVAA